MNKNEDFVSLAITSEIFDISKIEMKKRDLILYTGRPLEQICSNIQKYCHVFTKGETHCWRIQVCKASNAGHVRSKTSEQFYYHTDHSFSKYPPSHLALFCEHADRMGGGISNLISLSTILKRLSENSIQALKMKAYQFKMPQEFHAPYMQEYTEGKLPILYKNSQGELLIRYRYDIISKQGLPQTNLNALQQLQKIVETTNPFSFLLKDNQTIFFDNGKYLHARTEIKDPERLLYRIMFNCQTKIEGETFHKFSLAEKSEKVTKQRIKEFKNILNMQDLPFSEDVFHCDMMEFSRDFIDIEFLQRCLYTYFKAIVHLYGENSEMGEKLRYTLEWPARIQNVLRQLNKRKKFLPQFYRPDFLLEENEENGKCRLKLCEVNARFATNGFIVSLLLNEIACKQANKNQNCEHFSIVAETILKEFNNQEEIYFITNLTYLWDPILLSQMLQQKTGKSIIFIKSQDLQTQNGKLSCKSNQKIIHNAILELKQEELIELPIDVFQALAFQTKCINDLRSIFICHDKRLFSIIHNPQFYQLLRCKYLQNSELDFLLENTIKTWDRFNSQKIEESLLYRQKFVLKVPHEGKSCKMLFGFQSSLAQWKNYIESMDNFILQEYIPCKKISAINVHDQDKKVENYSTVGSFLCFGDQMWGMGMFRCGEGSAICLSNDGFLLATRIVSQGQFKYNDELLSCYGVQERPKFYSPEQIKALAIQKYQNLELDKNNQPKMGKKNIMSLTKDWKSKYISPSGGSTQKTLFIANGLKQNHYMRRQLAKEFQKHGIIDERDVCLNLFSGRYLYRSKEIMNEISELCGATPIPFEFDAKEEAVEQVMSYFGVNVILTNPSTALRYSHYFSEKPVKNIQKILYASEHLYDADRKIIAKAFPNAQFYSVFGSAETGVWGFSYSGMQDYFIYNYLSDIIKIDIEDPDEKGAGKLLVTNLIREATPVYRYETGDYGIKINANTFRLVPRPQILRFRINGCDFEIDEIHEILSGSKRWQIVLKHNNTMELRLEFPSLLTSQEKQEQIVRKFKEFVKKQASHQFTGELINVEYRIVKNEREFIQTFPSNKIYYMVDQKY